MVAGGKMFGGEKAESVFRLRLFRRDLVSGDEDWLSAYLI